MKPQKLISLMMALFIVLICIGCSDGKKTPVDLEFTCYEVKDGVVQEQTVPVRVDGYLSEHPKDGKIFLIDLHLPEDHRYGCAATQQPSRMESNTYSLYDLPYIAMPTAFLDTATDQIVWGNYALSIEDGYFFLQLPSEGAHYLVGSLHPGTSAQTILDYFQDFIPVLMPGPNNAD